jgi:hypothetical protein
MRVATRLWRKRRGSARRVLVELLFSLLRLHAGWILRDPPTRRAVPASPDPGSRPPTDEQIDAALHIREMIAARAGEAANVIEETAEPVTSPRGGQPCWLN